MRGVVGIVVVSVLLAQGALARAADDPPVPAGSRDASSEAAAVRTDPDGEEYRTVVSARRRDQDPLDAPRSVGVVDAGRAREVVPRAVPDLLDDVPGAFVQRTSAGAGLPFLRGLVGPDNLVLIDGIRYNNSTFRSGPNQYLGLLQPYAFRRVEVVRGPSSVLYGDGAMGGVIHLVTAVPSLSGGREVHGEVAGTVGAADAGRAIVALSDAVAGPFAATVGGAFGDYGDVRAGGGRIQDRTSYRTGGGSARLRWQARGDLVIDAAYLFSFLYDHERADDLPRGDLRIYDNDDHFAYVKARWSGSGVVRRAEASVSYHRTREDADRWSCTLGTASADSIARCAALEPALVARKRRSLDTVSTLGGQAEAELAFLRDRIRVTAGLDTYGDFVASSLWSGRADEGFAMSAASRGNYTDGSRYLSLGAFVHGEVTLWDFGADVGRIVASGGPRVSHFRAQADDVPGLGDLAYAVTGVVGGASLQWVRPGLYTIYASFDEGFRAPNLQETTVLGDTGDKFEIPNATLGPQRSDTIEGGVKVRLGWLDAAVAGFASFLSDLIDEQDATWEGQSQVGGKNVKQRVNKQAGRYAGVEAAMKARWWRLTLDASVAWMQGTVEAADGTTYPARRIPPVAGRSGLRYDDPGHAFYIEGFVRWAARQDRLHPGDRQDLRICADPDRPGAVLSGSACDGTPGWYTLNVLAGANLGRHAALEVAFLNLADARFRAHGSGLLAPGIDVRGTLRVRF